MKNSMLLVFLLAGTVAMAQVKMHPEKAFISEKEHFEVYAFQVEQEVHVVVSDVWPNANLNFYSSQHGGEKVKQLVADKQGAIQEVFVLSKAPAMLCCKATGGGSYVRYLERKEFVLQNIVFSREKEGLSLAFDAQGKEGLSYQFIKKNEVGEEALLMEFVSAEGWSAFQHQIEFEPKTTYFLKVFDKGQLRYTHPLKLLQTDNPIFVYPTITTAFLQVSVLATVERINYQLYQLNGQKVKEGSWENKDNTLDVRELSSGTYLLTVDLGGGQSHYFVKQ